ncbi:uncharacterized protein LOC135100325 [Scylla paramamosain]|uniref:uncharacterized protein LOC135100325 n=1 Tax=Scylla paramamosain TaxID=85552 RepID=UPI003083D455
MLYTPVFVHTCCSVMPLASVAVWGKKSRTLPWTQLYLFLRRGLQGLQVLGKPCVEHKQSVHMENFELKHTRSTTHLLNNAAPIPADKRTSGTPSTPHKTVQQSGRKTSTIPQQLMQRAADFLPPRMM